MLRFLLVVCLMILIATLQVFAQQAMEDVVHLKNGSVIRGTIIEQIPNESLKIETRDGNIFIYKMDEIAKMSKEPMMRMGGGEDIDIKKKDPILAFGLSFVITGLGQFYNEQYGKGVAQFVAVVAGCALYVTADHFGDDKSLAGLLLLEGGWLWSVIDAPISANKINQSRQPSYGHLIQLDGDRLTLGIDMTARRNGPSAMLTLHF